jgi:heterodisulfide reductase subunit B
MKTAYYPGCSAHATGREFDESLRAIAGPLGLELAEIEDWSCCGATSAHQTNHLLGISLPARNLALAEEQGFEAVLAPCAACYSRLATARYEMAEDEALAARVKDVLRRPSFDNKVVVQNITKVLLELAPTIREKATAPLEGLKVACYYGCLLLRPPDIAAFEDPEAPTSMETIVEAVGATPVDWHMRLDCCGGGFSLARTASVVRLGRAILDDAVKCGAEAVAVACPMCHLNLDFRQQAISKRAEPPVKMPILFVTQLVGLALGIAPAELGLARHFVSTRPVLDRPRQTEAGEGTEPEEAAAPDA